MGRNDTIKTTNCSLGLNTQRDSISFQKQFAKFAKCKRFKTSRGLNQHKRACKEKLAIIDPNVSETNPQMYFLLQMSLLTRKIFGMPITTY